MGRRGGLGVATVLEVGAVGGQPVQAVGGPTQQVGVLHTVHRRARPDKMLQPERDLTQLRLLGNHVHRCPLNAHQRAATQHTATNANPHAMSCALPGATVAAMEVVQPATVNRVGHMGVEEVVVTAPDPLPMFFAGLLGVDTVVVDARPVVGVDVEPAGVHHPPTIPGVTLTFDTLEERGAFTVVVDDAAGQLVRIDTRSFTVMPSVPC